MTRASHPNDQTVALLLRDLASTAAHLLDVLPAGDSRREHLGTTAMMAATWTGNDADLDVLLRRFGEAAGRIHDALPEGDHRRDAFGACARLRSGPTRDARRAPEVRHLSVVRNAGDDHTPT